MLNHMKPNIFLPCLLVPNSVEEFIYIIFMMYRTQNHREVLHVLPYFINQALVLFHYFFYFTEMSYLYINILYYNDVS